MRDLLIRYRSILHWWSILVDQLNKSGSRLGFIFKGACFSINHFNALSGIPGAAQGEE